MSIAVSEAVDFSPKEISAGTYNLRLVNPENGQPVLAVNSTVNTDFLLPNQVINLSRSYLNFNYLIAAEANKFHHAHSGFLTPIDGITLSTAGGVRLVEIDNVPYYTKLAWRSMTKFEDYMTFPAHSQAEATVADVSSPGQLFNKNATGYANYPPVELKTQVVEDVANNALYAFANGYYHVSTEAGTAKAVDGDPTNGVVNYICGDLTNANTALGVRVQLPLKMIYGTLLECDKDLYFNEQLRLTIRWNQGAKWAFTSATSPQSVAAASLDLAAAPTISSVNLKLAVEVNDAIAQEIKRKVMTESLSIRVPTVFRYMANTSATASDTTTIIRKLNRGHGARCLRMLIGVFAGTQSGGRYCNNYNLGAAGAGIKWSQYRCYLDSKPISDDVLATSDFSAWEYSKELLKGSVYSNFKCWAQAPAIIEDFSGIKHSVDFPSTDHAASGLDLSSEREFAFQVVNVPAAALPVYLFAICQKTLTISAQGVSLL